MKMEEKEIKFSSILACDMNFGIGLKNDIPWNGTRVKDADMAFFKRITIGNGNSVVIMGRKTWESFPEKFRPLPQRLNIILSSTMKSSEGYIVCSNLQEALDICKERKKKFEDQKVFVIGGSTLYDESFSHPFCEEIYLTRIRGEWETDCRINGELLLENFFEEKRLNIKFGNYHYPGIVSVMKKKTDEMKNIGMKTVLKWGNIKIKKQHEEKTKNFGSEFGQNEEHGLNEDEWKYIQLLKKVSKFSIWKNGEESLCTKEEREKYFRGNRTGVRTISNFSEKLDFDLMRNGKPILPLLTTKFTSFKSIYVELLWFLRGLKDDSKEEVKKESTVQELILCHNKLLGLNRNIQEYYVVNKLTGSLMKKTSSMIDEYEKTYFEMQQNKNAFDSMMKKTSNFEQDFNKINNSIKEKIDGIYKSSKMEENSKMNVKYLKDRGVNIWNGNTTREHLDKCGLKHYEEGQTGPLYGSQWRNWNDEGIDQIQNCIDMLRNNPQDRRMIVSAWNPSKIPEMALPPCHFTFQFHVDFVDGERYLNCQSIMRSADLALGVPFNIASYGLLTHIIAKIVDMKPGKLSILMVDCHVYENHIDGIFEQIKRKPQPFPKFKFGGEISKSEIKTMDEFLKYFEKDVLKDSKDPSEFILENYFHQKTINLEMAV